jgi:hypothetical protein
MSNTKEATIAGAVFNISQPYAAGHTLTELEANVLNQTRTENVRNNTAKKIKPLLDEGKLDEATALVAEYDGSYEFTAAREGAAKLDPIEKESLKIAKEALRAKIKASGRKVGEGEGDVSKEKFEAAAAQLAEGEVIRKAAKARLSSQAKLIESTEIDLG